jgi:hypothetical protein
MSLLLAGLFTGRMDGWPEPALAGTDWREITAGRNHSPENLHTPADSAVGAFMIRRNRT